MTFLRCRVFAVLGVLAAAACVRADEPEPPAIQDDAHLFDKEAADQAAMVLHDVGELYGLPFVLKTVEKPPEEWQKRIAAAKDVVQKDAVLQEWGAEEAQKTDGKAVHILVCKDAVQGSLGWKYGCVVITVPKEVRSDRFTEDDARTLHNRLRWFTRGNTKKNDAILLSAVAHIRDDLYYNHLPPFPWLGVGGVMAGALGLWGALALVRMRMRSGDAVAGPPEAQRPGLFAALLGGMFGAVAGHWIYDTLFVAASRSTAPVVGPPPAVAEKKEPVPTEAAEPPPATKSERLDLAARDHPTEEAPAAPGAAQP